MLGGVGALELESFCFAGVACAGIMIFVSEISLIVSGPHVRLDWHNTVYAH